MASAFHNRLVGTVILVALAVIFLPELLDGEKHHSQDRFATFPDAPKMPNIAQGERFPVDEVDEAVTRKVEVVNEPALDDEPRQSSAVSSGSNTSRDSDYAAVEPEPIREHIKPAAAGWVVQLGSFRHDKNVRELLNKLEKAGYRAFSRPVQTGSGPLTKVFVGPDLQQDRLSRAVPHLQELTGLKGKITPFSVE